MNTSIMFNLIKSTKIVLFTIILYVKTLRVKIQGPIFVVRPSIYYLMLTIISPIAHIVCDWSCSFLVNL